VLRYNNIGNLVGFIGQITPKYRYLSLISFLVQSSACNIKDLNV